MTIPLLKEPHTADEYVAYCDEVRKFSTLLTDAELLQAVEEAIHVHHQPQAYFILSDIAGSRSRKQWLAEHDAKERRYQRKLDTFYKEPVFNYEHR